MLSTPTLDALLPRPSTGSAKKDARHQGAAHELWSLEDRSIRRLGEARSVHAGGLDIATCALHIVGDFRKESCGTAIGGHGAAGTK
jgi:hypothetical protein